MKILFLTDRMDVCGGTEVYLHGLMNSLSARGVECWCISGGNPREGSYRHVVDARIRDWRTVRDEERVSTEIWDLLERERFDAVHVSHIYSSRLLERLALHPRSIRHIHDHRLFCSNGKKYFFGSQKICTFREGLVCFLKCMPRCLLRGWNKRGFTIGYPEYRRTLKACTRFSRVLVASRFMAQEVALVGFDTNRVKVLPYFVTHRDSAPATLPTGPNRVIFLGRLVEEKGVDILIQALALCPDVMASVVGSGPELPRLRRLTESHGLKDRIDFPGEVPNNEIPRMIRASHLLVVPSIWPEPFGIVGIEAMACGRTVIASRVGGIPDWLTDGVTGMLVEPRNPVELGQAIAALCQDPGRLNKMGAAGWLHAERYLVDRHLDEFLRIAC